MTLFLKKHWYILSIISILTISAFLRLYQLGLVPHGMTWDEAAIGYNGYAIFNTRRDEWLHKLPISFQSFGDYKAPFAIYLNGFFTKIFGMNLFAVRLPFALSGIATILGFIILTKKIFKKHALGLQYSIFSGFLIMLSPWHLHYSRAGFESGMALSFLTWGLLFLIMALETGFKKSWHTFVAVLFFITAIYTYHSAKIAVPLLLVSFFIIFFKEIWTKNRLKRILLPAVTFILLLIPFIKDSLFGDGLTRAGVTIFSSQLPLSEKLTYVINSYITHLSPKFLILGETTTLRHGTGYLGVLFLTTFSLVILGIFALIKNKKIANYHKLFFSLIIIGLLPASISLEVPHSNRSLLALPGFIFVSLYGLDYLVQKLKNLKINKQITGSHHEKNIIVKSVVGTMIMIHIVLSLSFLNHYFVVFARESAESFMDGYLEAFEIANKYEKGEGVDSVDKIIFTSKYGQPYIYALFVRKTNPIWYRGGSLIKYEFYDKVNIGDLSRDNALIVGSNEDDLPIKKADHIVYGSDGQMRFQIYKTKKK